MDNMSVIGNDISASWINTPTCWKCKKDFVQMRNVYRHPYILPCGHILCSSCVSDLRKTRKCVKCEQCPPKAKSIEPSVLFRLECDYHVMGFIHFQKNILPTMVRKFSLDGKSTSSIKKTSPEDQCVECSMSTKYICVQCNSNPYCNDCFHKVHSAGVIFRKHELLQKDYASIAIGHVLGYCKDHGKKKLDYYCQTCSLPVCHSCISTNHGKHDTTNLFKNNCNVDLDEPLNLLNSVRRMIDESKKSTVDCIAKTDEYALSTAQDIFSCFQYYHSLLQNLEREAYEELKTRTRDTLQQLHSIQDTLDTSNERVEAFITGINEFKKKVPTKINLATLQNEIMCQLEKIKTDFNFEQFNINPFIFNGSGYKKHCDLKDLCRVLFEQYTFTPKMKTYFTSQRKIYDDSQSDKNEVSFDISSSSGLMSYQNIKSKKGLTVKTRKVLVTEIIDPTTLCVQDIDYPANADKLEKKCNDCAIAEGALHDDVIIDEMYLVRENTPAKWFRGIVKKQEKLSFRVFLVDDGRNITVKKQQIRKISEHLKNVPKAAIEFTINVEPIDGEWDETCAAIVDDVALSSPATIIYTNEDFGDCIVHHDYPTSIQEMLLYLNFGKIPQTSDNAVNQIHGEISRERKSLIQKLSNGKSFIKQPLNSDFDVKVENIISPEQLYITVADRVDELKALHLKMQDFYDVSRNRYTRKIYCPHLQMPCSVNVNDLWHRARIEALRPGIIEVYLVDNGTTCDTQWNFLRALDDEFLTVPEGVSLCGLVDIAPKDFKQDWGTEATMELKRLCKSNLRAYVCGTKQQSIQIELFAVKKTSNHKINAYLAKNELVEWVGDGEMIVLRPNDTNADSMNASISSAVITNKSTQKKEFRQTVKILDIVSPGKLYVTLHKYESGIEKMHAELQNSMMSSDCNVRDWEEGDHCLVLSKISRAAKKCWYRGRIESNKGDDAFDVYLRDHGQIVTALQRDLADIPTTFDTVNDAAFKCHLANIKPTSSDWAMAAIDEFKHMITSGEEFDSFSVAVYGEKKDDSIPIYLWGRKKRDDALFGSQTTWVNINEEFGLKGFADCSEKFKTIVDCDQLDIDTPDKDFTNWYNRFIADEEGDAAKPQKDTVCDDDDIILESELDPEHEKFSIGKVESWPPAKPIDKYGFFAIPTYVDNNAIIYLHEQTQEDYLKQIRCTITKHIQDVDETYKWKKHEPCMVQFRDEFFYRGVIIDVLEDNQYNVKFVDYGNVEECETKDLRPANMLGNIPIQATKYYLAYIKPVGSDTIWNKKILEFMHSHIVDKQVYVRVEQDADATYVPCTISAVGHPDLNKILVAEKLAERTVDIAVQIKLPDTYDYYKDNSKTENRDIDLYKESSLPMDEFQEIIAKKNEAKKEHECMDKYDIHCTLDYVIEDSDAECFKRNEKHDSLEIDIDDDFEPLDTSSVMTNAMKTYSLQPFTPIKLSKSTTKFPCKIYEVLDPLHLFVEPMIDKYNDDFNAMEDRIKKSPNKFSRVTDWKGTRACLALYYEDDCYYRAIIKDHISKTHVRVRFVDYLNEQIVERKHIRECPDELVKKPLKHLLVKMHGVKPNKRIRELDLLHDLKKLNGRDAYAVIAKNDTIPSVHLYNSSNNSNVLVYQSLINSHFFTKSKD